MANMKNAKKKIKVSAKKKAINNEYKTSMRTAVKNVDKAVALKDKDKAKNNLNVAIKKIDKAASVDLISKNLKSRTKSRLTKKVNEME